MSDNETIMTLKADAGHGNEVTMKLYKDGAVSLSSDSAENFIYLHSEQVGVLKVLLSRGWETPKP